MGKPSPDWLEEHKPQHKMIGADWGNLYTKLGSMTKPEESRRRTKVETQQRQQNEAVKNSDINVGNLLKAVDDIHAADDTVCAISFIPKARDALKQVLQLNRKPPAAADALVRLLEDLAGRPAGTVNFFVDNMFFQVDDFSLNHDEKMTKFKSLLAAKTTNLSAEARQWLKGPGINANMRKLMAVFESTSLGKRKEPAASSEQPPSKH